MLTLNDGRNELWQWDTGRKLTVDADCSQVHFSNKVFGRSIDVDVVDGVAIIPDILLQTDKDLTAWAFVGSVENGYTKIRKVFKVKKRNKPADYVFTPPEQTTLQELVERMAAIEEIQDPDAIKNAVDDYLANNPIRIDEKDPTVPKWAKQTSKPKYTAQEVGAVATVNGTSPDENGNVQIKVPDSVEGAVLYTEQELTEEQKAQARKNIGVIGGSSGGGSVVGRFFGKNANFLGDSQTDGKGNYKSVFFYDWLKDILGLAKTNSYGLSATTIMPIADKDTSFLERYSSMADDADLIVVWGGTNDYHFGHVVGDVDDTDSTTFCGALNQLCEGLIAKYPLKSILFVTPTPRENVTTAVATQKEYADAIIEVCGKYCIPVFDAFRKCNMPILTDSERLYTVDGLHLNDLGHEILGKSIANFILYSEMAGCQDKFGSENNIRIKKINDSVQSVNYHDNTLTLTGLNQTFGGVVFDGATEVSINADANSNFPAYSANGQPSFGWWLVRDGDIYHAVGLNGYRKTEYYTFDSTLQNVGGGQGQPVTWITSGIVKMKIEGDSANLYFNDELVYSVTGDAIGYATSDKKWKVLYGMTFA